MLILALGARPQKVTSAFVDFVASLVFMVNQSGGSWQNPDTKTLERINAEIIKRENAKKK